LNLSSVGLLRPGCRAEKHGQAQNQEERSRAIHKLFHDFFSVIFSRE
jgi:hypothetical protein